MRKTRSTTVNVRLILFLWAALTATAAVAQVIVGDSLGIGTFPRDGLKADVIGGLRISPGSPTNNGVMQFGTPNAETGMTIIGTNRADLRFDGATLKLLAGSGKTPPANTNGIIVNTNGHVGIGTTNLTNARLRVDGGSFAGIYGTSDFGDGVTGEGRLGGVHGFCSISGCRAVSGISNNGIGVEGSSNGGTNFGVFSNGFLGVDRLGTGGSTTLCRNSLNQLALCSSSLRYKKDVQPFDDGLSVVNQLRPIAFTLTADHVRDVGFGAEDVARLNPLFVTNNDKGEIEGVKYDRLSVVFVNAFKEQQAQIEQQQRQLEQQRLQIEHLQKLICLEYPDAALCQER